jgi:hypothetical protein
MAKTLPTPEERAFAALELAAKSKASAEAQALAAEETRRVAQAAMPPPRQVYPEAPSTDPKHITKVLFQTPVSLPGVVWTFIDEMRDQATITEVAAGVFVACRGGAQKPARSLLIPWSNIAAVCYPDRRGERPAIPPGYIEALARGGRAGAAE